MPEKRDRLPWILLAIAIGGTVGAGVLAAHQAEGAREAKKDADEAWDSAGVLLVELEERSAQIPALVAELNAHWQGVVDSITVELPEVTPTDPWVETLLDTAQVTRELRQAIVAIRTERDGLRVQNAQLRQQVVDLRVVTTQALDSVTAFWEDQRRQDLAVIESLRTAVEMSREEANRWETAYYASRMSWTDRLTWGLGGAAFGYLANEFTGTDVSITSDYGGC